VRQRRKLGRGRDSSSVGRITSVGKKASKNSSFHKRLGQKGKEAHIGREPKQRLVLPNRDGNWSNEGGVGK